MWLSQSISLASSFRSYRHSAGRSIKFYPRSIKGFVCVFDQLGLARTELVQFCSENSGPVLFFQTLFTFCILCKINVDFSFQFAL